METRIEREVRLATALAGTLPLPSEPTFTHQWAPGLPKGRSKGLPLLLGSVADGNPIMTRYDSGTQANHMSADMAIVLGLKIHRSTGDQAEFALANGKSIRSIGKVSTTVIFANDSDAKTVICHFNVFEKLACPILMGLGYLNATEHCRTTRTEWSTYLRVSHSISVFVLSVMLRTRLFVRSMVLR